MSQYQKPGEMAPLQLAGRRCGQDVYKLHCEDLVESFAADVGGRGGARGRSVENDWLTPQINNPGTRLLFLTCTSAAAPHSSQ